MAIFSWVENCSPMPTGCVSLGSLNISLTRKLEECALEEANVPFNMLQSFGHCQAGSIHDLFRCDEKQTVRVFLKQVLVGEILPKNG